jgi:hypothetical protein
MDLYRVVPFKRLQQIVEQSALTFVSYRTFKDDPHEASLLRALTTSDGVKEISAVLKAKGENPATLLPLIMGARNADASAFMQCWTRTSEHNLMWERYGKDPNVEANTAVRMRMTEEGQSNLPRWVSFHDARYEDQFDIWTELKLVTSQQQRMSTSIVLNWSSKGSDSDIFQSSMWDFRQSLTFKLKAYQHENEVRLMTPILNRHDGFSAERETAPWKNFSGNSNLSLVPIGKIKNIIASIMTGPEASDDLQREVEAFCQKHGIAYEGRSNLRSPRFTGSKKIFTTDPDDAT